jgi:hypothetical protein
MFPRYHHYKWFLPKIIKNDQLILGQSTALNIHLRGRLKRLNVPSSRREGVCVISGG